MRFDIKEDGKRILMVCVASLIMALNIKTFVRTGGLYPRPSVSSWVPISVPALPAGSCVCPTLRVPMELHSFCPPQLFQPLLLSLVSSSRCLSKRQPIKMWAVPFPTDSSSENP